MKRPILTISDDQYLPGTLTMIQSILENTNKKIDVMILHDIETLSDKSKNILNKFSINNEINIKFIKSNKYEIFKKDVRDSYSKDYIEKRWNTSIWLQAFLSDAVEENIDEVIYIDSDTFFLKNPEEFFNIDLKLPMAAQFDYGAGTYNSNHTYPYFNAGVYITSLKYWRENNSTEIFLNNMKVKNYEFWGQDFLNDFFKNNWQPLGTQINVARECLSIENIISKSENISNRHNFLFHNDPILVHFLGAPKPWNEDYISSKQENWRIQGTLLDVDYRYFNTLEKIRLNYV